MEFFHDSIPADIDLAAYISRHSADKLVIYKYVDQEYLGYYFPPAYDLNQNYPAFIFIHGGAWESRMVFEDQTCWQGDYLGYLARYYAEQGFVCISIDYRTVQNNGQAPGYKLLDSYEDCCDAVEYIYAAASQYGIDPNRFYLLGESAGGHLAACVSTFRYQRTFSFTTVFLINPVTDMHDPVWNSLVPRHSQHPQLSGKTLTQCADFLSPLHQLDGHTSPTVLILGSADTCVKEEHSFAFYRKLSFPIKKNLPMWGGFSLFLTKFLR